MGILVLLTLLMQTFIAVSGGYVTFHSCERPLFNPSRVLITPNTPRTGTDLFVELHGKTTMQVSRGSFFYELYYIVSFRGRSISRRVARRSENICGFIECPVKPGPYVLSYKRRLPRTLPFGNFILKIRATDGGKKLLVCITIPLKIKKNAAIVQAPIEIH